MGFFDSLKGIGRAAGGLLGSVITTGAQIFGPSLAQAGISALQRKIGGGPVPFAVTPRAQQVARISASIPRVGAARPFPTGGFMPAAPGTAGRGTGFQVTPALFGVGTEGGGFLGEAAERFGGLLGGQTTFFRQGMATFRPVRDITQVNPATGKIEFWRHMGRPVLFTGDLATVRRVARVSGRLNRRLGRRRPR